MNGHRRTLRICSTIEEIELRAQRSRSGIVPRECLPRWEQQVPHMQNAKGGDLFLFPGFILYRAGTRNIWVQAVYRFMAAPQPFSLPTSCYWSNELSGRERRSQGSVLDV